MNLYNTLTRSLAPFVPLDPAGRRVTFYSCGPTVYDFAHIGNFRSFLNADLLRRTLELFGYEVVHVMNMTDVGHMTEDDAGGEGEDRMEVASRRLLEAKKSGTLPADAGDIDPGDPFAIAEFYAAAFLHDARQLGLKVAHEFDRRPELMPRPTRCIPEMIELVETLIGKGHAYVADDGAVYFDVQTFTDYGHLSGNTLDAVREAAGGRVAAAHQVHKRHPADFLLWKPDPAHLMRWPSPWGEGYPGWHVECSVMAQGLLGRDTNGVIDIHSGGEDNIFPHHECEIAQTRCATGADAFARYWFHTRHLTVEGDKMSKSKGNFYTLSDLTAKGASPAAIRLELTKTHYRSNANFTFQGLKDAQRQIDRWSRLEEALENGSVPAVGEAPLTAALEEFKQALADDLNVAGAIGALSQAVGRYPIDGTSAGAADEAELAALRAMLHTLGIADLQRQPVQRAEDEARIEAIIKEREKRRNEGDWGEADRIRDELMEMGIELHDGPDGTTWTRVVQQ
ncbi:MAG: cysteine--tRNA ligase [Planctomycetota bacterium]|jgi:cysteinyl-tRNA synthetase